MVVFGPISSETRSLSVFEEEIDMIGLRPERSWAGTKIVSVGERATSDETVDTSVRPEWKRTGYKYFPYAAYQSGHWWVLRLNTDFPVHDMFTLFVDGCAAADVTGDANSQLPLLTTLAALKPASLDESCPATLDPDTARTIVGAVSAFADYGSETGNPCNLCADDRYGLTRESHIVSLAHRYRRGV